MDGKEVDRKSIEHGTPITFPEDETFDVGQDTRTGVAMLEYRYDPPFKFTGKINKLTFKLEPESRTRRKPRQNSGLCQRRSRILLKSRRPKDRARTLGSDEKRVGVRRRRRSCNWIGVADRALAGRPVVAG